MRKCSRTISAEQLAEIKEKMSKCPRCGTTMNGHHLFDCPFVGPGALDPSIWMPDEKAFEPSGERCIHGEFKSRCPICRR